MPDLTIINNLDEAIHVAFFVTAPTHWKNNLQPGERWTTHLPTLPLYFQARWVERGPDYDTGVVYRSREFCPEESWEMGATIGTACALGTASVVIGTASLFTGWPEIGVPIAGPLMAAANLGKAKRCCLFVAKDIERHSQEGLNTLAQAVIPNFARRGYGFHGLSTRSIQ